MHQPPRIGRRTLAATFAVVAAGALLLAARPDAHAADKDDPVKAAASPLDYVPADSPIVISLRVADYWSMPRYHAAREAFLKGLPEGQLEDFRKHTGVGPDGIDRVTYFLGEPSAVGANSPALGIATFVKPYDQKIIRDGVAPDATEEKAKGRAYYDNGKQAVAFLDDHSYVIGEPAAIKAYLSRPETVMEGPMKPVLKLAAEKHLLVAGITGPMLRARARSGDEPLPAFKPPKPLSKVQLAALVVDLDDALATHLRFTFANEAEAKREGAAAISDAMDLERDDAANLMKFIHLVWGETPKVDALMTTVQTGLRAMKVEQQGATVEGVAATKMDPDELAAVVAEITAKVWQK